MLRVIVIGSKGSGKSTAVARIARACRAYGYDVTIVDDPQAQEISEDGPLAQVQPMRLGIWQFITESEAAAALALPGVPLSQMGRSR